MPMYEYYCNKCNHAFDDMLSVSNRNKPTKKPCPECKEKGCVVKGVSATTMGVDANVTPDKKTGGDWSRLMDKIKHGTPKRYHEKLDKSSNMSGRKLGPQ